jgi:hypothetical protein
VGTNPNQTRALFDSAKTEVQQAGGNVFQDLPGVGDAAFVGSNDQGGACYVLKGSILGHITVYSRTALTAPADALTTLCRALAGRL